MSVKLKPVKIMATVYIFQKMDEIKLKGFFKRGKRSLEPKIEKLEPIFQQDDPYVHQ